MRENRPVPALLTVVLSLGLALPAQAQVCGDVNASGGVTASDALTVLKFAVGQDVELSCTTGDCAALETRVGDLEDALATTQAALADLQDIVASLQDTFAGVERDGNAIVFSGVNVQVVDGSGATAGPTNGLGNLIVGYNERSASQLRTGSHNLVVGEEHAYSSFAGIVAGEDNAISSRAASVVGGKNNTASGLYSSVCGGSDNTASGQYASVGAGFANAASGVHSAVSGGCENQATNTFAAVSGGQLGLASGQWSSVSGGFTNKATSTHTAVSGGSTRTSNGPFDWRAGSLFEDQ